MNCEIQCTGMDGESLEKISDVIQRRCEVLHQTTQQAVTALTIQALKSLRADAIVSKGTANNVSENAEGDLGIRVNLVPDLFVSFTHTGAGKTKPCLRRGSVNGTRVTDIKPWWQAGIGNANYKQAKVFKVTLSDNRAQKLKHIKKESYLVAKSLKSAIEITQKRFSKIAKKYVGLGKDAWSRAMMLASDRPATFVSGPKAKQVLANNVVVTKSLQGDFTLSEGSYSITVSDNLDYAVLAQRSGEQAISNALMKATNSVNGMINNYIKKTSQGDFFGQDKMTLTETPFSKDMFGD